MLLRVPVVLGRLQLPILPLQYTEREQDRNVLQRIRHSRVCLLTAPLGYGKTSFFNWVTQELKRPVAWVHISADMDLMGFFNDLVAALSQSLPGWGAKTADALAGVDSRKNYTLISSQLAEELWEFSERGFSTEILLVLDDWHHLMKFEGSQDILEELLFQLPDFIHFCISSRSGLHLEVTRREPETKIILLDKDFLSFSSEKDVLALFNNYHSELTLQDAELLISKTQGWAALLIVFATLSRFTKDIALITELEDNTIWLGLKERQAYSRAFHYFLEVLFTHFEVGIIDFLLQAAHLEVISLTECQALLGSEATEYLEKLYQEGFFLTCLQEEVPTYVFHDLLQSSLQWHASERALLTNLKEFDRRLALYYEEKGEINKALLQWFKLANYDEVAALLIRQGDKLLQLGLTDMLIYWLDKLPEGQFKSNPQILYLTGIVFQRIDPDMAIVCLQKAARAFEQLLDFRNLNRALIGLYGLSSISCNTEYITKANRKFSILSTITRNSITRGVNTIGALIQAVKQDDLKQGIRLYRIAQLLKLDQDLEWIMLTTSCQLFYQIGDLTEAEKFIRKGLDLEIVKNNPYRHGFALICWNDVLVSMGDLTQVLTVAEELWVLGERYDSAYYRAVSERSRALTAYYLEDFIEADEHLNTAIFFFQQQDNQAMSLLSQLNLAVIKCAGIIYKKSLATNPNEQRAELEQLYHEALLTFNAFSQMNKDKGLSRHAINFIGLLSKEAELYEEAEQYLLSAYKLGKEKGSKQSLADTCLHLADLYFRKDSSKPAQSYLREGWKLMSNNNYQISLDWYRPTVWSMGLMALELGIEEQFVSHFLDLGFKSDEDLSLANVTINDSQINKITVRTFGYFEIRIAGKVIPQKSWQTRKIQSIFKYLLLQRGRIVSTKELLEVFWSTSEPIAATAALRVALKRLSLILQPHQQEKTRAQSGPYQEHQGTIWLELDYLNWDVILFENALRKGLKLADNPQTIEEAINLLYNGLSVYQGELFQEERYSDWASQERKRSKRLYLEGLNTLLRIYFKKLAEEKTNNIAKQENKQRRNSRSRRKVNVKKVNLHYRQAHDLLSRAIIIDPFGEEFYLGLAYLYLTQDKKLESDRVLTQYRAMQKVKIIEE